MKSIEIESRYCFRILIVSNFCRFFNKWEWILNYPKLFKIRTESTFVKKNFQMRLYPFENIRNSLGSGLVVHCFDATIKQQAIGASCTFGSQFIIGRSFCFSVTVIPTLKQYLRSLFIIYYFNLSTLK